MRVFLDTNVLVSAFAARGLCADVLRLILADHVLLVGEVVLEELDGALRRKFDLPGPLVADIMSFLRDHEVIARPAEPSPVMVGDPDDRWVLANAMAGEAEVLVTGDGDLLALGADAPLTIVDPRGFWDLLRRSPPSP